MRLKACIVPLAASFMLQSECGALGNVIVSRMVGMKKISIYNILTNICCNYEN